MNGMNTWVHPKETPCILTTSKKLHSCRTDCLGVPFLSGLIWFCGPAAPRCRSPYNCLTAPCERHSKQPDSNLLRQQFVGAIIEQ